MVDKHWSGARFAHPAGVGCGVAGCGTGQPTLGMHRVGAAIPPPFPNPRGGTTWYHGTSFDPDEANEQEEEAYPGGTVRAPERYDTGEYGDNVEHHWNTDLGAHFTSMHDVAHTFATGGRYSAYSKNPAHIDSRILHAGLHMANPAHYENERDLGKHAITWAHEQGGFRFLPHSNEAHGAFLRGDHDEIGGQHDYTYLDDHVMDQEHRAAISGIDRNGVEDHHSLHHVDNYLRMHPMREEIVNGFQRHLKEQGHDGIIYGNDYEGPKGHACAIAFHDTPVHHRRWQWLHESQQHMNGTPEQRIEHEPTQVPWGQVSLHLGAKDLAPGKTGCWRCSGRGEIQAGLDFSVHPPKSVLGPCTHCDGSGQVEHATYPKAEVPKEQEDLLERREGESYDAPVRRALNYVRDPKPGTVMWRGEIRHKDDIANPPSVGMHWTINPNHAIIGSEVPKDHVPVLWEARLDHPQSQAIPRSHPVWGGRFRSMDSEAEIRLHPETHVHVTRAIHWTGDGEPGGMPWPSHPERTDGRWQETRVDKPVEVRHRSTSGLMDYSQVGLKTGSKGLLKRAVQDPPSGLEFSHEDQQTGGSKHPIKRLLRAHLPDAEGEGWAQERGTGRSIPGTVGEVSYYPPKRSNGIVVIDHLGVAPEHRRKGIASALMDEVQRRHPGCTINHGDRTTDGKSWWSGYTDGQRVTRGRTLAAAGSYQPDDEHGHREEWSAGDRPHFEYHCYEGHDSADAQAWYRSHQPVTVLHREPTDDWKGSTFAERGAEGMPRSYRVRWDDGYEHSVFEDELLTHPQHYHRPDPPMPPSTAAAKDCPCCGGAGEHSCGHECYACDASGQHEGSAPCEGHLGRPAAYPIDENGCDYGARPENGMQHQTNHVLDSWEPKERLFAPTKGGVDPRLFGPDKQMLPNVRLAILAKVHDFFEFIGYGDTTGWARVYLAGSQASEWYGNNDFDILVGIEYAAFRRAHPDLAGLSVVDIDARINDQFRKGFNDENWHPPFDPEHEWHLTGYVNKNSWDIAEIKPYAAYDVTDDRWAVEPIDEPTGHQFGPTEWYYFEGVAAQVRNALALPEPLRTQRCTQIWTFIHTDRSRAFGPHGSGAFDRGNALEKYLDQAPSGIEGTSLMGALQAARFGTKTAAAQEYFHGTRHTLRNGQILEGGTAKANQGYGQPAGHVYYSGRHDVASYFAEAGYGPEGDIDAPPRVYKVEPLDDHEVDPDEDREWQSFRSKRVRVLHQVPYSYPHHLGTKTAGANGDLPDLHYQHHDADQTGEANSHLEAWRPEHVGDWSGAAPHARNVYAGSFLDPGHRPVASISWDHGTGEIKGVYTVPEHKRKGIASELLRRARQIDPRVHHSTILSDSGQAWSQHVGGLNGDLPEGLEWGYREVKGRLAPQHQLWATHPDIPGQKAALIRWHPQTGEILGVSVNPALRRRGLASELLRRAREIDPNVKHSDVRSDEGEAWAGTTGDSLPPRKPEPPHEAAKTAGYAEWQDENHRKREGEERAGDFHRSLPGHQVGEPWSNRKVGWVKTEKLLPYREYDRTDEAEHGSRSRQIIDAIKDDLNSGRGWTDPISLSYHHKTHRALVDEGNHRLAAAAEAGQEYVPVVVNRAYNSAWESHHPAHWSRSDVTTQPDDYGYVPGQMHPREVLPEHWLHSDSVAPETKTAMYGDAMGEQDWDEVWHDVPDHIHRGVGVTLPDDLHRFVHDESQPVHERARALLSHLHGPEARTSPYDHQWDHRNGLGTSWSGDDGVAESFAEDNANRHSETNHSRAVETGDKSWGTDEDGDPVGKPGTAVVLTAHKPPREAVDEDSNGDGSGMRYTYHGHGEREMPLHGGTEMHMHSISWRPVLHWSHPGYVDDPETYTTHHFGDDEHIHAEASQDAQAALRSALADHFWIHHPRLDPADPQADLNHRIDHQLRGDSAFQGKGQDALGAHEHDPLIDPSVARRVRMDAFTGARSTSDWMEFDDLPEEAKNSVRHMRPNTHSPEEMEARGRRSQWQIEHVPTEEMKRRVMSSDPDLGSYGDGTFEGYHRWYLDAGTAVPDHGTSRWPVIEHHPDDDTEGYLDDGWHRLHSYIRAGDTHIPLLRQRPKPRGMHAQAGLDDDDYRMSHRPPGRDGTPIHDLTHNFPEDIYTHPHYYSDMSERTNVEAHNVINRVRNKPDAKVHIYRALPAEYAHQGFRPGDWVSTSKEYARNHGVHHTDPKQDWPVIHTVVRADDLHTDGDDFREFGYNGTETRPGNVAFKGGYHQEVSDRADGGVRKVVRRGHSPVKDFMVSHDPSSYDDAMAGRGGITARDPEGNYAGHIRYDGDGVFSHNIEPQHAEVAEHLDKKMRSLLPKEHR